VTLTPFQEIAEATHRGTVSGYVTATTWLWNHDARELAMSMRDELLTDEPAWREEMVKMWNDAAEELADYAQRHDGADMAESFRAVKV
jgi:hypothetical protein